MANKVTCPYCEQKLTPDNGTYPNHLDAKGERLCDVSSLRIPDQDGATAETDSGVRS